MGVELFERGTNPIRLTPHGRVFLECAQRVIVEYDAALRKMRDLANVRPSQVRVVSHMGVKPVDDLVRRCRAALAQTHPLLAVEQRNADVASPVSSLLEGDVDVALVSGRGTPIEGAVGFELFEEPLAAVVRRDHRLAGAGRVTPRDLVGEVVWFSLSAPVARHYLAIQDILESEGADALFREIPFHGSPDALDLSFDKGVYVDGAAVIAHSMPLIALADDYVSLPVVCEGRLVHRMLVREGDDGEAVAAFVETMLGIASRADMRLYWT